MSTKGFLTGRWFKSRLRLGVADAVRTLDDALMVNTQYTNYCIVCALITCFEQCLTLNF